MQVCSDPQPGPGPRCVLSCRVFQAIDGAEGPNDLLHSSDEEAAGQPRWLFFCFVLFVFRFLFLAQVPHQMCEGSRFSSWSNSRRNLRMVVPSQRSPVSALGKGATGNKERGRERWKMQGRKKGEGRE